VTFFVAPAIVQRVDVTNEHVACEKLGAVRVFQ